MPEKPTPTAEEIEAHLQKLRETHLGPVTRFLASGVERAAYREEIARTEDQPAKDKAASEAAFADARAKAGHEIEKRVAATGVGVIAAVQAFNVAYKEEMTKRDQAFAYHVVQERKSGQIRAAAEVEKKERSAEAQKPTTAEAEAIRNAEPVTS